MDASFRARASSHEWQPENTVHPCHSTRHMLSHGGSRRGAGCSQRGAGNMAEVVAIRQTAAEGPVVAHLEQGILRLTLANPPANALSIALMAALQAAIERAGDDPAVRVVVLAASGK